MTSGCSNWFAYAFFTLKRSLLLAVLLAVTFLLYALDDTLRQ